MHNNEAHPLLFPAGDHLVARRLSAADAPLLQVFLEANPEYFHRISGTEPAPDEAATELAARPPAELSWRAHVDIGFWHEPPEAAPQLIGFAIVDSDLAIEGCWHVALFIVATALHGQGVGRRLYQALEDWARVGGARWMRLCVVQGNSEAERFWQRQGFVQLRLREGVPAGLRLNTVRVMLKPLQDGGVSPYLDRVPRDRPDTLSSAAFTSTSNGIAP
jgi:GNAT superfamily N-acetyltransferase